MKMNMVSMKMSAAEKKKEEPALAMEQPNYPYGLKINLDKDAIEKLGIELPAVGENLQLHAMVTVTDVHASESETGKYASCSLQITDLALEAEGREPIHKRIYKAKE